MQQIRRLLPFRIAGPTLSGLWYAYLWMMLGALILSLLLRWTNLQEDNLSPLTYVIHGLSVFAGSFISGKRSDRKGWYQGALTGTLYSIVLNIISFLALDATIGGHDLLYLIPAFIIGAAGGIFGKNAKKN
ncbi:TIGR04086 family membrane protein [Paenibacillus pinistramenti]|uniref:TIGR04086 family membrane protein n=1 Tax=Paenibacillus pinistramenti TaxID=1768003 RepID=UPI001107CE09|nr:TIGR04086 family membrane protein [Paenibacillus pinistramenti]